MSDKDYLQVPATAAAPVYSMGYGFAPIGALRFRASHLPIHSQEAHKV
jgi:hypothetical protein